MNLENCINDITKWLLKASSPSWQG